MARLVKNTILFFTFISFLFSCGGPNELNKEFMVIDFSFAPYVASYTSGVIRKNDEIRIKLQQSPQDFEQDVFHISPSVKGNVRLDEDKRTLIFKSEESLKNGQIYQVGSSGHGSRAIFADNVPA